MRRWVRSPVSRFTTAAMSSSVCRLPFISASALPFLTRSTAAAAAVSGVGLSTISTSRRSMSCAFASARIFASGPNSTGAMSPMRAASIAPASELWSQGYATAVGVGGSALQNSIRRWYFSCLAFTARALHRLDADFQRGRVGLRAQDGTHALDHRRLFRGGLGVDDTLVRHDAIDEREQPRALVIGEEVRQGLDRLVAL